MINIIPCRSAGWKGTFHGIRDDLLRAADAHGSLRHRYFEPLDDAPPIPPHWRAQFDAAGGAEPVELPSRLDPDRKRYSCLYGPEPDRQAFDRIAEHAWVTLPGTRDGKAEAFPGPASRECWLAFVYHWLLEHPGNYMSADRHLWVHYRSKGKRWAEDGFPPEPVMRVGARGEQRPACREAIERLSESELQHLVIETGYPAADSLPKPQQRWLMSAVEGDPFRVSAAAIDVLLADPYYPNGPYFITAAHAGEREEREQREATERGDFPVGRIVLGEGQEFPIFRNWCRPISARTPSICPNADPPGDQADRSALKADLPRIVKLFRDQELITEAETLHWVGRQARLGSRCRCFDDSAGNPAGASSDSRRSSHPIRPKRGLVNDARDRWLYQQCRKGKQYKSVRIELNRIAKDKGWRSLGSVQAVPQAVQRYTRRHGLDPLPRRVG